MPRSYAGWFRFVALAEAVTWAALLLAMAVKYGLGYGLGVTIVGWAHGLVFTAYVLTCLVVFSPFRWRFGVLVLALIASVPPCATVLFERWATRRDKLVVTDSAEPTFWGRVRYAVRELN